MWISSYLYWAQFEYINTIYSWYIFLSSYRLHMYVNTNEFLSILSFSFLNMYYDSLFKSDFQ